MDEKVASSSFPSAPTPPPPAPSPPHEDNNMTYEEKLLKSRDHHFEQMKGIQDWIAYAQPWFTDIVEQGEGRLMLGFAEDRIPAKFAPHKLVWNTLLMNAFIPIEMTVSDDPVPWYKTTPPNQVKKISFITGLFPKQLFAQLEYMFHVMYNERYQIFNAHIQYPTPSYPLIRAQFLMELHSQPPHRVPRYFPSLSHYGKTVGYFLERVNPKLLKTINDSMFVVHILDRKWNHGIELFQTLATVLTARVAQETEILKMLKVEDDEFEREELCSEILRLNPSGHTHKSLIKKSPREIRLLHTTERVAAKQREVEWEIARQLEQKNKQEEDVKTPQITSSFPLPKPEWIAPIPFPPPTSSTAAATTSTMTTTPTTTTTTSTTNDEDAIPAPPTPPPRPPTPPSPPSHTFKTGIDLS